VFGKAKGGHRNGPLGVEGDAGHCSSEGVERMITAEYQEIMRRGYFIRRNAVVVTSDLTRVIGGSDVAGH